VPGAEVQVVDITHFAAVRAAMRGCQAVVHLAAIPNPKAVPGPELFPINVTGTYNVFEAAAAEGIRRVVQISSINALGCYWGNQDITVDYLPIDEAHPTYTTDAYSFSKELAEDIGAYYWRRNQISSVALRYPGVWPQDRVDSEEGRQRRAQAIVAIDDFAAQPEAARAARLARLHQATEAFRRQGNMEYQPPQAQSPSEPPIDDPLWPIYNSERLNFWAYVDARDAAQAVEKGLVAEYEGAHALFINAQRNVLNYDSQSLGRLFYPEAALRRDALQGSQALVSIAKAQSLIGFEPEFVI
jgi:hypothetical protein